MELVLDHVTQCTFSFIYLDSFFLTPIDPFLLEINVKQCHKLCHINSSVISYNVISYVINFPVSLKNVSRPILYLCHIIWTTMSEIVDISDTLHCHEGEVIERVWDRKIQNKDNLVYQYSEFCAELIK